MSSGTGYAFPCHCQDCCAGGTDGLTKREIFSAMAMQSVITLWYQSGVTEGGIIARDSLRIADALLAALAKEEK